MPPALPDRYRLEVRLGRDQDVEEWLGTDTSLERPVLVRIIGPDAPPSRRVAFLSGVRAAAAASHTHLASVYAAEDVPDGAFSVSEWTGGVSLGDRIEAGATLGPTEFLANAAGLADGLAALHASGAVHGAINPRAVSYSVAHAAKLGAFGRPAVAGTASEDVRDLARTLETALTGRPAGGPPPSELVDGLSSTVDRILADAQAGYLSARTLADELRAVPTPERIEPESPGFSRRLLVAAGFLVVAALGLVALARVLAGGGGPILVPEGGTANQPLPPVTSTTVIDPPGAATGIDIVELTVHDPFGEGGENDVQLPNLVDGDPATTWSTERYRSPLPRIKPGVGLMMQPASRPVVLDVIRVSDGVTYSLRWSTDRPSDPGGWEEIVSGTTVGGSLSLRLPPRQGGAWLLWLTELPQRSPGVYSAEIGEVRFRA
jgi:serine/threonine protein kinase